MRCKDCGQWLSIWHCYTEEGWFCKEHGDWRRMLPFDFLARVFDR